MGPLRAAGPLLVAALLGCGDGAPSGAVGANDEISVFSNLPPHGAVADTLRWLLEYPVQVVGTEDAFRLDFVPPGQHATHRLVKNQVVLVDASRDDAWVRDLPRWLRGKERLARREPFRLLVADRWATGQTTLFVVGWSEGDLLGLLAGADSTEIRRAFEDAVVTGLTKTMFSLGEETDLSRRLARDYGWTIRLPRGYAGKGTPERRRATFHARDPVRLVLVEWMDGAMPLRAENWEPVLAALLAEANDGDVVLGERTTVREDRFQEGPALRWEGVWQNDTYVIGGPFRAVAFRRPSRSYLLVGQVFAPGGDKVAPLRQVEAAFRTFREVS